MVLYFFVICYIRTNFASRWKIWPEFWKRVEAKIASFFLLCFRWLFRLFHHCQNIVYSKFYIGVSKFCLGFYMLTGAKSCMFLLFYNFFKESVCLFSIPSVTYLFLCSFWYRVHFTFVPVILFPSPQLLCMWRHDLHNLLRRTGRNTTVIRLFHLLASFWQKSGCPIHT